MVEHKIQERFFEDITGNSNFLKDQKNGILAYRQLVFFRFYEALKNAYPLLFKLTGEGRFREIVSLFIKNNPASPFIWQSPFEFRKFILTGKILSDIPSAGSLLTYELVELELLMGNYSNIKESNFTWNASYKISKSARLLPMNFPVHKNDFKNKGKYHLLLYYDYDDHKVFFIESSKFMFSFIKILKQDTAINSLKKICADYHVDADESKSILEPVLTSYCAKKILVPT